MRVLVIGIITALFSMSVQAIPVVSTTICDGGTVEPCATSITGLELGGMTFDVVIISGLFDELYPDPTLIPFWNDQSMATMAGQAMNAAVTDIGGFGYCAPSNCITNPFLPFSKPNSTTVDVVSIPIQTGLISVFGVPSNGGSNIWADFTKVSPVPEPSTLGLLAAGLLVLLTRRKRLNVRVPEIQKIFWEKDCGVSGKS